MKKILYSLLFLAFVAVGCEEFEPGGTATQNLSGDWWVKAEYYDAGSSTWVEIIPDGGVTIHTYNTAANVPTEFFIDDRNYDADAPTFWDIKGKVQANAENATFGSATDTIANLSYESKFIVVDGQVLKGVGHSKTGVVTDSIVFVMRFDDDSPAWGIDYRISGHRRTGFNEDEY